MFDTMTMTKLVGGFCGAFLVFLLGGFFAEFIYHDTGAVYDEEAGHGGAAKQAYVIDTGAEDHGGGAAEEAVPFADVLASADPSAGEGVFRKCQSCHSVAAGENKTGPSLHGVVGRPVDSISGFSYSGALEKVVDVWTPEHLNEFLANPKGYAPGTAMNFAGIGNVQDRANLIAWLETQGG